MTERVTDDAAMTEDASKEAQEVREPPPVEAGESVPAPEDTESPRADAGPETAPQEAPPVQVEPMEEPVSEGVGVLDVPEEPPLPELDEEEREALGEPEESDAAVEAPTGLEEAEAAEPEPDLEAAPEPVAEVPEEEGQEAADLMGEAEEEPEEALEGAEEAPAVEAPQERAPVEAEDPAAETPAQPASVEAKETPPGRRDPFRGPGDWYVVHTYAGYENKVKANLESRIRSMQMEDKIFDVHIPMEDVMEIKGGKKQVVQRKVFPGYLLVKMIYDNDSWYVVRNTPGVTGFVSSGTGTKPTPLSRREVEKILAVKEEVVKPTFRLEFEEGDTVRIISGPFADFNGTISEINVDQSKLKVLVNIFDRETPVELGFDQVAKV
jgi:transcriptional antiterminator NusG